MTLQSDLGFSFGSCGTGRFAAASASSPRPRLRPLAGWTTRPPRIVQSSAAVFQRSAAASTSMVRAAAPTLRSLPYISRTEALPPVA
jgi:hypothetical protein